MKKQKKRVLAVVLILCMMLGMLPVLASAKKANTGIKDGYTYIVLGPDGYTNTGSWKREQGKDDPFPGSRYQYPGGYP